ncbi:MAG: hypothetical protein JNK92_08260 [Dechloromonas sp.]|uniref:Uncharacterized protein n=1 Tax=Candidatus Dechloromonas phosphorivorans TaxID=2899244 RepID=A0A9D7LRA2_9RHOO|nr:hypothetical protein [Candidatus Dechloromonas phosphorivorans]MBL8420616.1 hypothetical protein [Dechloromonas sp.]
MLLCPIALVATCNKCPVVKICPVKTIVGDYAPPPEQPPAPPAKPAARRRTPAAKKPE